MYCKVELITHRPDMAPLVLSYDAKIKIHPKNSDKNGDNLSEIETDMSDLHAVTQNPLLKTALVFRRSLLTEKTAPDNCGRELLTIETQSAMTSLRHLLRKLAKEKLEPSIAAVISTAVYHTRTTVTGKLRIPVGDNQTSTIFFHHSPTKIFTTEQG